jgi:hypothetical protein
LAAGFEANAVNPISAISAALINSSVSGVGEDRVESRIVV